MRKTYRTLSSPNLNRALLQNALEFENILANLLKASMYEKGIKAQKIAEQLNISLEDLTKLFNGDKKVIDSLSDLQLETIYLIIGKDKSDIKKIAEKRKFI